MPFRSQAEAQTREVHPLILSLAGYSLSGFSAWNGVENSSRINYFLEQ